MAVNRDKNSFLSQFTGRIGNDLILKQYDGYTVLSKRPDMSRRKLSPKQKEGNEKLATANFYGKAVVADQELKAAVAKKLGVRMSKVYHAVVAEFIKNGEEAAEKLLVKKAES